MFAPASKAQTYLRAMLYGPSGSGKTFSALRIASGMGQRIAVIDTERGSARKYSDRFDFQVCEPEKRKVANYIEAIEDAGKGGFDVLVIDSLSHAWQELLVDVEKLANAKYRGNTWSAWSEGTPLQRKLVDAILDFPGHVLATTRSKTEWQTGEGSGGKSKPVRVGLAPEQGKGLEYEFDLVLQINPDHVAFVEKDRTGKFQDEVIEKPDEEFGAKLKAWLSEGPPMAPKVAPPPDEPTDQHIGYDRAEEIRQQVEAAGLDVLELVKAAQAKNKSYPANIAFWPRSAVSLAMTWIEKKKPATPAASGS